MKKVIILVFMLGVLSLVYQYGVTYFISEKDSEYVINTSGINFVVKESFKKRTNKNLYQFEIENSNTKDVYNYLIDKDFNSQNVLIKDIKSFEQGGLKCIMPVFRDNSNSEILCESGNDVVSYSYLKQTGNNVVDNFVATLKNEGFSNLSWESGLDFEQHEDIQAAINFPEEFGVALWAKSELYLIQKNLFKSVNMFTEDKVDNSLSALAGGYYVTVNTDDAYKISKFDRIYLVNATTGLKDFVYVEEDEDGISKNIYFAGVVGNNVYIVDKTTKKEYELNAVQKTIKVVGDENLTTGKYYDGKKLVTVGINDMVNQDNYFRNTIDVLELTNKYGNVEVKESNNKYYFRTDAGDFYYTLKDDLDHPVKLFTMTDFREWKVIGDSVFGINGNTAYIYDFTYGLKPLVRDSRLASRSHIFNVFKK